MRLTTKGRFAVTAMVDLGMRHGGGPVTLAEISQRQKISLSYLEQLFGKLRRNYGSMVMNAVFSQINPASNNIWVSLIGRVLENDKLRSGMNNLVDAVSNKVGDGVNAVSQKLFHKKSS